MKAAKVRPHNKMAAVRKQIRTYNARVKQPTFGLETSA